MISITGLYRRILLLLILSFAACPAFSAPGVASEVSGGSLLPYLSSSMLHSVGHEGGEGAKGKTPDDVVGEADDLYTRLIALLRSIDGKKRYRAASDSIRTLWRSIATLKSRYPDIDADLLNDALFEDSTFLLLGTAFDEELERVRRDLPEVGTALNGMIEKEIKATVDKKTLAVFDEMMSLYEGIILRLEAVKTGEDAERSYDTLHALALRLKDAESRYGGLRDEFQLIAGNNPHKTDLSNRINAAFTRLLADPDMKPVFDALKVLSAGTPAPATSEPSSPSVEATPEERQALKDYGIALENVVVLFRNIRQPEDVEKYRTELRELIALEQEFDQRLPGERGEKLIESDPYLIELLQELGKEQMRISDDPPLNARLSTLLGEGK